MPIKANDFVELEYTGRVKESNIIFDTTNEETAKANDLPKAKYGPVVVCIGQGQLLKGLEDQLIGKDSGNYNFEISAENAFGKKNAKLIQMVPINKFRENKIQPQPGLVLNIDGNIATVLQVTGGRVMVDFNHPLSGKDVVYDVKVNRMVTDKKERLNALFAMLLNISDAEITVEGGKARIALKQKLPEQIIPELQKKIKEILGIDSEISLPKEDKKEEKKAEKKPSKTASQ